MVKNKLYLNRIFCLTLVVASLEFILCNHILACCSPKKYIKRDIMGSEELYGDKKKEKGIGNQRSFESNCYNVSHRTQHTLYVHDLYCREKGFFYKFFLQEHTTSRTYYLCWTIFEHVLKNLTGVVWIYKNVGNWEFYYGSVIGLGWYPQCLKFNKLSVGFFDVSINLTSVFMKVCHFLCRKYFHMVNVYFLHISGPSYIGNLSSCERTDNILLGLYKKAIKETKYILVFDIDATSFQLDLSWGLFRQMLFFLCGVSFINIKTKFGIKIKMLQLLQIAKLIKFKFCLAFSNISILVDSIKKKGYDSKRKVIYKITYHSPDVFIYSYMYDSHFFFGERDNIFWLLLELFIPSIEICLNHDNF